MALVKEFEVKDPVWRDYGTTLLSIAVIAILISAPLGAIFINVLGTKSLDFDEANVVKFD